MIEEILFVFFRAALYGCLMVVFIGRMNRGLWRRNVNLLWCMVAIQVFSAIISDTEDQAPALLLAIVMALACIYIVLDNLSERVFPSQLEEKDILSSVIESKKSNQQHQSSSPCPGGRVH